MNGLSSRRQRSGNTCCRQSFRRSDVARNPEGLRYALLVAVSLHLKSTYTAQAQAIYGSVYGTVTDKTGRRHSQCHDHRNRREQGNLGPGDLQPVGRIHGAESHSGCLRRQGVRRPGSAPWRTVEFRSQPILHPRSTCNSVSASPPKALPLPPRPHSFKPIARTLGLSLTREPFPACPSRGVTLPAFNC